MKVLHLQGQKDFSRHFQIAEKSLKRILYCFLFSLSIEKIDASRGLDSRKNNEDENMILVVRTSLEVDE